MSHRLFRTSQKSSRTLKHVQTSVIMVLFVVLVSLFTGLINTYKRVHVSAASNNTINYQARILQANGAVVADGAYNVEFKIYDSASSGSSAQGACTLNSSTDDCWWIETRTGANKVTVKNGYITVALGSVTAFGASIPWDQQLWVTMNIGGTGSPTWDGEMTPRMQVTAVPYAYSAAKLQTTSGANTSTLNLLAPTVGNQVFQIQDQGAGGTYNICIQNSSACGFLTGTAADFVQNQNSIQQATSNFWISGTGRADTAYNAPVFDTATGAALSVGTVNATSVSVGKAGANTTINGALIVTEGSTFNGNVGISGSNTLTVGTGATTLGGTLTVSGTTTLNGTQLTNNGSTLFGTLAVTNRASSGDIDTAANTVDIYSAFAINQTTGSQVLSLPAPTSATAGRVAFVSNVGSATFMMHGFTVDPGGNGSFVWNGTAWAIIGNNGGSGNYIQNQGVIQQATSNFWISGNGRIDGSVITSTVNSVDQTAASTNSSNVSIRSGNAAGATSNSGNVSVDAGTATGTAGQINIGTVNASGVTIGRTGATTAVAGAFTVAEATTLSGNFSQTGATTFSTGTGAVSLNGATTAGSTLTVTGLGTFNGGLTVATGSTFTNGSSTLNSVSALGDFAGGGSIGSAATTVDVRTAFTIAQTTASQTLTIPSPTNTAAGRIIYISNIGSANFTIGGNIIAPGNNVSYVWNGTAWAPTGVTGVTTVGAIDSQTKSANGVVINGANIYLQTADATNVGLVSTGAQTFAGAKTFSSLLTASTGLTIATGSTFTNGSSTLNTAIALSDFASGGSIGSAATTVDVATSFTINQTTASQTITIPSPTVATAGRTIYISNIGSQTFTILGFTIAPSGTGQFVWNGSAWTLNGNVGGSGNFIQNQNSIQQPTSNFWISGTGRADTSFTAPSFDRATAGTLSLGTSANTTALTIGGTSLTGTLAVDSGASSTINIGSSASARTINIGNVAAAQTITVGSTNGASALTLQSGTGALNLQTQGTGGINIGTNTVAQTVTIGNGTGASSVVINSGTGPINIGTNAIARTITVGNATGASALTLQSGTGALNLQTQGTGGINIGTNAVAQTIAIGNTTGASTTNITAGTGNINLNAGQTTNAGATLNTASALGDLAAGALGTAAATVNSKTAFTISPTASGRTYTIPSPTTTTAGRIIYIQNINATNSFTIGSATFAPGSTATYIWDGTAWRTAGIDTGVTTVGAVSGTPTANGATITGTTLNLAVADGSNAGLVSTSAQTFGGAKTFTSLLQGTAGLTVTGAAISLNDSSNFNTSINGGTSTGTITIGNSAAGAISLQSGSSIGLTGATNINTTGTANTSIGNATGTLTLTGATTVAGTFSQTGANTFGTGTGAVSLNGATSVTGSNTLTVGTGATSLGGDLTVTGATLLNGNTTIGNASTDRLTVTSQILGGSPLVFQGATDNGFTTTFAVTDPTANNTITFPDSSGTVQLAPASGSYLFQIPTSTAANTVTPTANSVVGLTVNGTIGTAATALAVSQPGAAAGVTIASANNTATNGLSFSGTFTNLINSTNFNVSNAGAVTAVGVNSGTGLLQGTGGLTVTGNTSINSSGSATTTIGNSGANVNINGNATFTTGSNNVTFLNGTGNFLQFNGTSGTLDLGNAAGGNLTLQSAATISVTGTTAINTTGTANTSIGNATGTLTLTGATTVAGTFSQTGANTFGTGTGAVSLNGATSVTGSNTLTVGTGATSLGGDLTVTGATLLNGNTTIGNASTDRLTVTSQILGGSPLVFQGATDNGFTTTFAVTDPTANNTITFPDASGTVCLSVGNCSTAGSGYVLNQSSTPGSAQTGNINMSGTIIGANLQGTTSVLTPLVDTVGATALALGTTNATQINLNQNTVVAATKSLTVTSGATALTGLAAGGSTALSVTTGATNNVGLLVQGVASQASDLLQVKASGVTDPLVSVGATGAVVFQNSSNSTTALQIKTAGGTTGLAYDTTGQTLILRSSAETGSLGSELASNNFSANWNGGGNWTLGGSSATHNTGNTTTLFPNTNPSLNKGDVVTVSFDVSGMSAGAVYFYMDSASSDNFYRSSNGTQTGTFVITGSAAPYFSPTSNFNGTISNVSFKKVNQAPALSVIDASGNNALELRASTTLNNQFIGQGSGNSISTGTRNNGFGLGALTSVTTGARNNAFGYKSLTYNVTGNNNAAFGDGSLKYTTGSGNTGIGTFAGQCNTTGSAITAIGYEACDGDSTFWFLSLNNLTNATAIGAYSQVFQDNTLALGGQGVDSVKVGIGTGQPTGTLSAESFRYGTGTVTTSNGNATITGSGTTWTSSMVGNKIYIGNDSRTDAPYVGTITAFNSATSIDISPTPTFSYSNISYYINYVGLQVSTTGTVGIGTESTSTSQLTVDNTGASTNDLLVLKDDGVTVLTVDASGDVTVGQTLTVTGGTTLNGDLAANSNTTIGNATTDRLTVTSQILGGSPLVFQGATDNGFTSTFAVTDPTANNTITFPNASGTVLLAVSGSGNAIVQVPTAAGINVITPTANSVVGLTVNGTTGTSAQAAIFNQSGNGNNVEITSTNTGTQTNGLLVSRNNGAGTTTNLLQLANTAGIAANGLTFTGTYTNLINATNFTVSNAGAVTAVGVNSGTGLLQGTGGLTITGATSINASGANATNIGTGTNTGAVTIGGSGTSSTITLGQTSTQSNTINIGAAAGNTFTQTINVGTSATAGSTTNVNVGSTIAGSVTLQSASTININAGTVVGNATTQNLFNTIATTVNAFGASTNTTLGATSGTLTVRNANQTFGNAAGSGLFQNNGATRNATLALGDLAAGALGTAAATVDVYGSVSIAPTVAGRTYTIPSPTSTTIGRVLYISNIHATNNFIIGGTTFNAGATATMFWNGTAWAFAGMDGGSNNYIQNQSASDQSASFRLGGTAAVNFTNANAFRVQNTSGADTMFNIDTTTGNAVKIGNNTGTGTATTILVLDSATTSTGLPTTVGAMYYDTTAGRIQCYEGAAWGNCGNTTLQEAYTSSTGGTTPEILVDSTRNGVDIQDANTTLGNTVALLAVRASATASTLGGSLFQVNNNAGVPLVGIGLGTQTAATGFDLQFGGSANRTIQVLQNTGAGAGRSLTVKAGQGNAGAGGILNLAGGDGQGTNQNGGNVSITGGVGTGTGVKGLVVLDTATLLTASVQSSGTSVAITQANVDSYGAILLTASAAGITYTLGDPTLGASAAGRLIYITNSGLTNDFTLSFNGGGVGNTIAMKTNTTATMIWNGTDWTAAGASSSTDLQAAYNNTLSSAGGAEIVLNNTASSNGFTVRNNLASAIQGGLLEVQSSIGTNLFSVNNLGTELAANGGAETVSGFGTNWSAAPAGGTVTQTSTAGQFVTGVYGVSTVTTGTSLTGVRNNLSGNPSNTIGAAYQVSFTAKSSIDGTPIDVVYSRDGGTNTEPCTNYSSQTLSNSVWTKITCTITISNITVPSNPDLIIRKTGATTPTIYIDNLSFMRNDLTTQPSNVQIGGGVNGGPITLFTLDRSSAPPVAAGDSTYWGSMYYDTTTGSIQCYESDGWGACGSPPANIITLTPEYPGAVLGDAGNVAGAGATPAGVGTMTAEFCSNEVGVIVVGTLCSPGEARNYYRWTSPQATDQTYSVYVTYKLPTTFKEFDNSNTIKLTAYTTSTTLAKAELQVFRKDVVLGEISSCGAATTINSSASTWQQTNFGGDETACNFAGGDYVIFKINVVAKSNASVYIENLDFTFNNR